MFAHPLRRRAVRGSTGFVRSGIAEVGQTARMHLHELHQSGTFVVVNVHDVGSGVAAADAGAVAVATTSSGHARSLGRDDGEISKDEALRRAADIAARVDIPVTIDAENFWCHSPEDVAATVAQLIDTGAKGASIEDWPNEPGRGTYEMGLATERVQAAVEAAAAIDPAFVICARADGLIRDIPELDDAITRLRAFSAAGAGCVYAPGIAALDDIARVVSSVDAPVNALVPLGSPLTVPQLAEIGVRRISIGGSLQAAAYDWIATRVRGMLDPGSFALD